MATRPRFNRRRLTPAQREKLYRITNFQQLKALREALAQGEAIPDYAWSPLPQDFDWREHFSQEQSILTPDDDPMDMIGSLIQHIMGTEED